MPIGAGLEFDAEASNAGLTGPPKRQRHRDAACVDPQAFPVEIALRILRLDVEVSTESEHPQAEQFLVAGAARIVGVDDLPF